MIDATDIAAARAAAGGRRLVDVLEERLALEPDEFAARLGGHLPRRAAAHGGPAAPRPGVRPGAVRRVLAERLRRCCAIPTSGLLLATDDPFSAEQEAWAAERVRAPFAWRLVHRGDLVAYLASHEETLRALDAVREDAGAAGTAERARRGPVAEEHRRRDERGGAPGALDAARRAQDRRERHPPRDRGRAASRSSSASTASCRRSS